MTAPFSGKPVRHTLALSGGKDSSAIPEAVKTIKAAILHSRYQAARLANAEMLKLYFAIGGYVSANVRSGRWGEGVIRDISEQLSRELPGLRGFSPSNMKMMRQFFESWADAAIGQPAVVQLHGYSHRIEIRQPMAVQLGKTDAAAFMAIGFSHHMAIIYGLQTLSKDKERRP